MIKQIFYIKNTEKTYEIPNKNFEFISIEPFGNCYYCCVSYFLYKNQNKHLQIRESIFNFVRENKELFLKFFEREEYNHNLSLSDLLDNYIFENNVEGEYVGEIEYIATCKLYKLRIIILSKGFYGLNLFNIISDEKYNIDNYKTIYLLLINDNLII